MGEFRLKYENKERYYEKHKKEKGGNCLRSKCGPGLQEVPSPLKKKANYLHLKHSNKDQYHEKHKVDLDREL